MVKKTESSELQPGRKMSAFAIFNPAKLTVLQDLAVMKPLRPVWSACDSDKWPGSKVDFSDLGV
jgi:hypothetical protein